MNALRIFSLFLSLAALAAIVLCVFTDWNDGLYLPLALVLVTAANALNVLDSRRDRAGKKEDAA